MYVYAYIIHIHIHIHTYTYIHMCIHILYTYTYIVCYIQTGPTKAWRLSGKVKGDQIFVDFSPKGGPKVLYFIWFFLFFWRKIRKMLYVIFFWSKTKATRFSSISLPGVVSRSFFGVFFLDVVRMYCLWYTHTYARAHTDIHIHRCGTDTHTGSGGQMGRRRHQVA